jgi:hypothetical protein
VKQAARHAPEFNPVIESPPAQERVAPVEGVNREPGERPRLGEGRGLFMLRRGGPASWSNGRSKRPASLEAFRVESNPPPT